MEEPNITLDRLVNTYTLDVVLLALAEVALAKVPDMRAAGLNEDADFYKGVGSALANFCNG